ncbi:hypothetical protein [Brevibacillus sp. SAFN-007a]|uniref:hypothetical protein n=1 Tax=Brevibacillus sp. SAFN-007a TaxID=3436862 RepID=UPI003F7DB1DA
MIRVVNVRGFENNNIVPSMIGLEDRIVFLVYKNIQHEDMYFDKLVKYHVHFNEFEEWFFPKPVGITSNHVSDHHFMYYASTEWDNHEVRVEFYNFDCDTFTNRFICSINLADKNGSHLGNSTIAHMELYGMDERYCIVALPKMSDDANTSSFFQVFLLDSVEKRLYPIPDMVGDHELFSRFDQLYIQECNGDAYLFLKTGRFTVSEKRRAYQVRKNQNHCDRSLEAKESIICLEIKQFITRVKKSVPIGVDSILDSCMNESAFSLMISHGPIFYCRYNFDLHNTEMIEIDSGQICKKTTIEGVENRVKQSDGNYFLIKEQGEKQRLIDLENENTIFITSPDERILEGNSQCVITKKFRTNEILYYSLLDDSSIKLGTGFADFDPCKNELIIFHE